LRLKRGKIGVNGLIDGHGIPVALVRPVVWTG
jgi:hypothetical protein